MCPECARVRNAPVDFCDPLHTFSVASNPPYLGVSASCRLSRARARDCLRRLRSASNHSLGKRVVAAVDRWLYDQAIRKLLLKNQRVPPKLVGLAGA